MARLIIKNGYLKSGSSQATAHLNNLVKYIATRDGVVFIHKNPNDHATLKQEKLIQDILREFPSLKESHEYEDYKKILLWKTQVNL